MNKVFIKTLGCKVNSYDSDALVQQFKALGLEPTQSPDEALVTVVNTCSVTAKADKEARYLFRRYRRDNPGTKIVATGCYAQVDSASIAGLEDVDYIVPNEAKNELAKIVTEAIADPSKSVFGASKFPTHLKAVKENRQGHFKTSLQSFPKIEPGRTRAFLKIQDGCNGFCSYCLIPYARGASRSVAPQKVYDEVCRLVDQGVKEIVFTGIHIGDYGEDLATGKKPFVQLLEKVLGKSGLQRFRISSLEPREASQELIETLARFPEKICDHFHLPLQSGHDRVLKLMRRQYDTATYTESIERIRRAFPRAMIGADIIPGFPSESESEHLETMQFIEGIGLHYLHVFPYSKRPNTAASKMPGHLEPRVIKQRVSELRILSDKLLDDYYRLHVETKAEVLWENDHDDDGRLLGHTKNYLAVAASKKISAIPGELTTVKLGGFVAPKRLLCY